jgi:hypothetical protein
MMPLRTPLRPPGAIDITVDDSGFFAAFVLRTPDSVDVQGIGASSAVCDRVRKPTGAPGPVRCEYAASGAHDDRDQALMPQDASCFRRTRCDPRVALSIVDLRDPYEECASAAV